MNCHHCHRLFATKDQDKISISRTTGRSFWFHKKCFEEIAGEEYIEDMLVPKIMKNGAW